MKEIEFRAAVLLETLGEPTRFSIIRLLETRPRSVSELARLTKRCQETTCHHLAVLRLLQVVRYRNRGRFTFYELKLKGVSEMMDLAVRLASRTGAPSRDSVP
jgi:DNA-binding transcriptional ArsR family regulator